MFELITDVWKLFQTMKVGAGGIEEVEYDILSNGGNDIEVRKYKVYLSSE